jgi:hypothetical protein
MNQGIILNGKTISKRERRIILVKKSLSKKTKKVIEENLEEFLMMPPLRELTRIGAKMMLQSAMEEEVTTYLERDFYERTSSAKGSQNRSKPRTVKIGSGDIWIRMPQVKNAGRPFHSQILPPRVTQVAQKVDNDTSIFQKIYSEDGVSIYKVSAI